MPFPDQGIYSDLSILQPDSALLLLKHQPVQGNVKNQKCFQQRIKKDTEQVSRYYVDVSRPSYFTEHRSYHPPKINGMWNIVSYILYVLTNRPF